MTTTYGQATDRRAMWMEAIRGYSESARWHGFQVVLEDDGSIRDYRSWATENNGPMNDARHLRVFVKNGSNARRQADDLIERVETWLMERGR